MTLMLWEGPEAPDTLQWEAVEALEDLAVASRDWGLGQGYSQGQGCRVHRSKAKDKEWIPITQLGHLVKDVFDQVLGTNSLFSLPIKESEIIDFFLEAFLKDEDLKFMPMQKQTRAGQRTQFKAFVTFGTMDMLLWVLSAPRR